MDKRVIFAVAGSGKTTCIIGKLNLSERSILVTYTKNNTETLKRKVIKKFGYMPNNIVIYSYFSFLYSFCYKPFCSYKVRENGITYNKEVIEGISKFIKKNKPEHYLSKNKWLYSHRLSKLLVEFKVIDDINNRLSKYFDNLFIDEIQDFAANDFNFIKEISKSNINMLFVGDFYQHTFDTSRDGNTNKSLHKDYIKYKKRFLDMGLTVDKTSLIKSHRCTATVCKFINQEIGINIESHNQNTSNIDFIENQQDSDAIIKDDNVIKLFYQSHIKYDCFSENWGASKGKQYKDVCVVLNAGTLKLYKQNKLDELTTRTKNKFYVACSRAKNNLYFVPHHLV